MSSPRSTPEVTITKRLTFDAAHRLYNGELTDDENRVLFGKCSNPNGHGHTYTLEVSVAGRVDRITGFVADLGKLKQLVEKHVVEKMDHKNLNSDVSFLTGINPTAENIVVACWRALEGRIVQGTLIRLRLWETPNNYVEYEGR